MKTRYSSFKILAAAAIIAIVLTFISTESTKEPQNKICFQDSCIEAELAKTPEQITTGLMNRPSLAQTKGMLFIFENIGVHMFWMKNTLMPLDMIWLDQDGTIIYIEHSVEPCKTQLCPTYGPESASKYVLETNAGYVLKHSINIGDKARMNIKQSIFLKE